MRRGPRDGGGLVRSYIGVIMADPHQFEDNRRRILMIEARDDTQSHLRPAHGVQPGTPSFEAGASDVDPTKIAQVLRLDT